MKLQFDLFIEKNVTSYHFLCIEQTQYIQFNQKAYTYSIHIYMSHALT